MTAAGPGATESDRHRLEDQERWRSTLSAFAAGMEAASITLADGEPPDRPSPWPPADLPAGPIPDRLRPEAERLLADAEELRSRLGEALVAATVPAGRPSARRPGGGRPSPGHARWSMDL